MDTDTEKGNTPIADAFAYGRPVDPEAMVLIRKLETDRAALLAFATASECPAMNIAARLALVTKYPLDRL